MDSIVKAARDAVLQELGKQGEPAQPVSEASGLGLEDNFDELKSQSSAVYQELGRTLKSLPRLASAIGKIISDAGKPTTDGYGGISLIGIVLGSLAAASFAAWLTKWALERWLPDFKYSEAMIAKGAEGVVWDEATLTAYLPDPKAFVPKTKMVFAGIKKPEDIKDLIAFLKANP